MHPLRLSSLTVIQRINHWPGLALALALILIRPPLCMADPVSIIDLNGPWQFAQADHADFIPATVPGCVHTDLLANRKIPDPFFGDNEKKLQWISDTAWTYRRHFVLPDAAARRGHLVLRCEGLDTLATISINGRLVARTDNMFRTYELDVRPGVHPGENVISITFTPLKPYIDDFIQNAHGNNSASRGLANVRKAPYSNGWDFGPRFLTSGIYKSISLIAFDRARLTDVFPEASLENDGSATVKVHTAIDTADTTGLQVRIGIWFGGKEIQSTTVSATDVTPGTMFAIHHPQLWWPAGMGDHPLYEVRTDLLDAAGQVIDSRNRRFGIRKIELLPPDHALPLRLKVNGRPMFVKGENWIPSDMFAPRVTTAKIRQLVADAVAVHENMLRAWGGGYYEEDSFYDACDEAGLLVWSEFKFACAVYPGGNPAFRDNVLAEVTDQMHRLRSHPCIAVWSGNNEVISLVTGFKILKLDDYNTLFHRVIGQRVQQLLPEANYVGGSPEAGDEHNWWVWHVGANFEKYFQSHGWMTEFGFQSFPCPATVASYTSPADRDSVLSPVNKAHQHNGNGRGNEMILEMMGRYFRPARDFDSTLWLSQINQAYGVSMGIEHWRADWPRSSGALVWQYDDCWPGVSWSSVDYFGRWKAMHYQLARAFSPLLVTGQFNASTGHVKLTLCSDDAAARGVHLRCTLVNVDGSIASEKRSEFAVPAGPAAVAGPDIELTDAINAAGRKRLILFSDAVVDKQVQSRNVVLLLRPKSLALQNPAITFTAAAAGSGFEITLQSQRPALWVWCNLHDDPDARWSDNFFHLRPGEPYLLHLTPAKTISLVQLQQRLTIKSLYDTYDAAAVEPERVVHSEPDGSVTITADAADIIGTSAKIEAGHPANIGGWTDPGDQLEWTLKDVRPGAYRVTADIACPHGVEGSQFVIAIGDQKVFGTTRATTSWTDYQPLPLGTLTLARVDTSTCRLRVLAMPHGNVMNLRSIRLVPINLPATSP